MDPDLPGVLADYLKERWHPNDDHPDDLTWLLPSAMKTSGLPHYVRIRRTDGSAIDGILPRFSPRMVKLMLEIAPLEFNQTSYGVTVADCAIRNLG